MHLIFSFIPCKCASFLSLPCKCISLTVIARLFIFVSSFRSFLLLLLLLCIGLFFYKTTIALLRRGCLSSAFSPKVFYVFFKYNCIQILFIAYFLQNFFLTFRHNNTINPKHTAIPKSKSKLRSVIPSPIMPSIIVADTRNVTPVRIS